ncbi:AlpA family transcriptional regulator [Methylococcus sp. EFPC2]|uniref:helix-turn-helix transcriptional regulator n=1 Tax=Methylococcus sp. EFPC2 TaxID=2812648 RepID=UPI0019679F59|nr:AlpA family phage regulatory protein [Methylococcus sp. EFPC2]QSA97508.1 AlpA family phage regulatory protein [Methylococcus sp. EFPC2]
MQKHKSKHPAPQLPTRVTADLRPAKSPAKRSPKTRDPLVDFDALPDSGYVRVDTLAALFACSKNTVWRRSKDGTLPAPVKLGPSSTAWRVGDIRAVLAKLAGAADGSEGGKP